MNRLLRPSRPSFRPTWMVSVGSAGGIKSEVRDVTKRLDAYRGGLIPKENIAIERYREYQIM